MDQAPRVNHDRGDLHSSCGGGSCCDGDDENDGHGGVDDTMQLLPRL